MEQASRIFTGLVNKYDQGLTSFARSYVKNEQVAEELVSDVFYKLWEKRGNVNEIENIESYLYKAVKNSCLNFLQSKTGQKNLVTDHPQSLDFLIEQLNPEIELLNKELLAILNKTVENLPHSCKVVFKLVKEQGMTHAQVANVLDISPKTVENQIAKAIKRLREALKKYKSDQHRGGLSSIAISWIILLFFTSSQNFSEIA